MALAWLAGCWGRRKTIEYPHLTPNVPTLPLTLLGPAPAVAPAPAVEPPASRFPRALTDKQRAKREWQFAFAPASPERLRHPTQSPLLVRARILEQLRALGSPPAPDDLSRMLEEGLTELRLEGQWMDALGSPKKGMPPSAGVIAYKADLLKTVFSTEPARRTVGAVAIASLLLVRDESLCHRGAGRAAEMVLEHVVRRQAVLPRPLAQEVALACAPAVASPLASYLPSFVLEPNERAALKRRIHQRISFLDCAPQHRSGAADVLFGGRLRLLEECDVLATVAGIDASPTVRQKFCRACLFDLEIIARLPWMPKRRGAWPAEEASLAWLLHRERLLRLFSAEALMLRTELARIENKVSFRQPETMQRVFAALRRTQISPPEAPRSKRA